MLQIESPVVDLHSLVLGPVAFWLLSKVAFSLFLLVQNAVAFAQRQVVVPLCQLLSPGQFLLKQVLEQRGCFDP